MGNARVTTTNLEIVEIDNENDLIYIKGSVPGARNGMVYICGAGELKIEELPVAEPEKPILESVMSL